MIELKCNKCNKIFDHKHNYVYHMRRKNSCNPLLDELKIKKENNTIPIISNVYDKQKIIKEIKNNNESYDSNEINNNLTIYNPELREPICVYCNKIFSSNSHRNRHMNGSCKIRQKYINLIELCDKEIENLIVENNFLKNKYLSLFGDKYLFPFGMEKFININTSSIINTIKNPYKGLPEITEKYHFNPKEIRYHNIRVKNPKSLHLEIYNGSDWIIESKENVITTLIRTYKDIIDMEVEKYYNKISLNIIKNYNDFSEAIDYYISFILYECEITNEQKKQFKPMYNKIFNSMELMIINTFRKDEPNN